MKKNFLIEGCAVVALVAVAFYAGFNSPVAPATPWQSIGGCGAGGSGGGSGDGIKWIGQGVSGGSLEAEVFTKYNVGQKGYLSLKYFSPFREIKTALSKL